MLGSYTTTDGHTLTVFGSLYMDYGLKIEKGGEELFYNPCYLSNDNYGSKPNPDKFDGWDDAEQASLAGDIDAFVPWTEEDWVERLQDEADDLIEQCLPEAG